MTDDWLYDVAVVGGAGHVGLPLCLVLASKGMRTLVHDVDKAKLEQIRGGELPYVEENADGLLQAGLERGLLTLSSDIQAVTRAKDVIVTIGTPVDEFMNPVFRAVTDCLDPFVSGLTDDHMLILRSTVCPGVTDQLHRYLAKRGKRTKIAFCPERVVQGYAIDEIQSLPQIVSGTTPEAAERAAALFARIAPEIVRLQPMEAEFAKLFSNAYRYIQFATSNQFYMMVNAAGLDYSRIYEGMKKGYSRLSDFPGPGFTAGPCLYKDTVQLAAFNNYEFSLGLSAVAVNEGLPLMLVNRLARRYPLRTMTVGILGMAFKANSDDIRSSLSYKLRKALEREANEVLCADPHVTVDAELVSVEDCIERSDLLVIGTPHSCFRDLDMRGKPVADVWNFCRQGNLI